MMYSGLYLEDQVREFCQRNSLNEGSIWQIINKKHTEEFGRNIMFEKQQHEKENNLGDIAMSQYFAKCEKVSNAIEILKGLQNCIEKGWGME